MVIEVEDDSQIVAGLRRCEDAAFDALYTRYRARIHAFLLRLTGRRDVAEDLFQETWARVARAAPRLREETRLAPWLFTIARNQWVSHRRWAMLDLSRLVTIGDDAHFATDDPSPEEALSASRAAARIERAIGLLPAALREALLLVAVEGFDQREAAEILGVRYDLVRQRVTRARERIAALLLEAEEEAAHTEASAAERSRP
jgi:RNA polymerase sigma-70 factor (ECF subfamily)